MTDDSRRSPAAPYPGDRHNCGLLLRSWQSRSERCATAGIPGPEAATSAMAAGLVIDVWRNGPAEDTHCARRGPGDTAMFAGSTSLHDQAVNALAAGDHPIGLLEFEDHLLDRGRPRAGTGGKTLNDLGYGFLGQYRWHVKDHINTLLDLGQHPCVADPPGPLLISTALLDGGPPSSNASASSWPIQRIPPGEQTAAAPELSPGCRRRRPRRKARPPPSSAHHPAFPFTVLEWLSHHLLYCAAPPYSLRWDEQSRAG